MNCPSQLDAPSVAFEVGTGLPRRCCSVVILIQALIASVTVTFEFWGKSGSLKPRSVGRGVIGDRFSRASILLLNPAMPHIICTNSPRAFAMGFILQL